MLSRKHQVDVCGVYQGSSMCRYLEMSNNGSCVCLKLRKIEKKQIDDRVVEFLKESRRKNIDPFSQHVPLGNNCSGYPLLKHVEQGYDQKN